MVKYNISTPHLICKYIIETITNIECLYNDRTAIKPLELDIYYPNHKFAIEYDGSYYHKEDNKKYDVCKNIGIYLITITEQDLKNKNLIGYIEHIKNNIISNLSIINNIFEINLSKEDILNIKIDSNKLFNGFIDKEKLVSICSKYTVYSDFIKENKNIYNKLYNSGLLYDYTNHMLR